MKLVRSPRRMARLAESYRRQGLSIGFVPTMGALHEGHLSLIRRARRENSRVVVSVFVNPRQFGPKEDFKRYPRPFAEDSARASAAGTDALYRPAVSAMYPPGFGTRVEVEDLSDILCGESRPGHFQGVATVVLKLLEQVRPDKAYFGEKDFQQLTVVRRMSRDLDLPVRIAACPTVRAPDGLALSSRNRYLNPRERTLAPGLHRSLRLGAALARQGRAFPGEIVRRVAASIRGLTGAKIEYVRLVEARTLAQARRLRGELRLLAAIRLGRTRLIDNVRVICEHG